MTTRPQTPIVAGVDGSPASLAAAEWAAGEAVRRRLPLRLVHGYLPPPAYATGGFTLPDAMIEASTQSARAILDKAADRLRRNHPDLAVSTALTVGNPPAVLVTESERASCVVVGGRGTGGFAGLLAGSVATQVAAHAHAPVIVFRPGSPAPGAPVVVGLDGSEQSSAALPFAFDAAASRGVPLVAIYVWQSLPAANLGPIDVWSHYTPEDAAQEAQRLLAEQLAGWQDKYPDLPIEHRAVYGFNPTDVLVEASRTAGLLVVGCRGRGGFASLLLGSVSRTLVTHAACSVAVIHTEHDTDGSR